MKIQQIVDNVQNSTLNIPSFQRGYVWPDKNIAALMDSLYRGYPIGIITTWKQPDANSLAVDMVVDGQQRIASIYACYKDTAPPTYREWDRKPRTGLHFHILKQEFDFSDLRRRRDDPMWVKVSDLFGPPDDPATRAWRTQIKNSASYNEDQQDLYDERINRVKNIKERDIAFDQIESERSTDEVVEMFDRINSRATSLKREELEIARMSTKWTDVKEHIRSERDHWKLSIIQGAMQEAAIIRSMHASYAGGYQREGLRTATAHDLEQALGATARCNEVIVTLLRDELGMYDTRAIKSVLAFPALTRYLRVKGQLSTTADEAKALAYVLVSNAWNIYRSFTDTMIDADVKALQREHPWDELEALMTTRLGKPTVNPQMFSMTRGSPSRYYTLFHAVAMRSEVRDWDSLKRLRNFSHNGLQQHHIFPRVHLQTKYGGDKAGKKLIEDIGNIAIVSEDTNLRIGDTPPEVYLKEIDDKDPKLLGEHCITRNRTLWNIDRYREFLEERRGLLATAAQELVDTLLAGKLPRHS